MQFALRGKTALVTGGSGYLGREMCSALASAGAYVLVNGRDADAVNSFVDQLRAEGHQAEPAVFDVTDSAEVCDFARQLSNRPLDVLVNNAYAGGAGTIALCDDNSFEDAFQSGIYAAHRILRSCLSSLKWAAEKSGDASVINITSMYGIVSPDQRTYDTPEMSNPPYYGAVKAALAQYTRYAACEFGSLGIRVNAIAPGPFPSADVRNSDPEFIARLANKVPLGRVGAADEIAGPVLFLASSAASFVTGGVLVVDGGWTAW